jgi:hypothetical protein
VRSQTQLPPGLLDEHQVYQFKLYHERWQHLETLALCSPGGMGVLEHELFIQVLHALPALKNLCVSSFDADDFHNTTLLSLPKQVTTLRLEECSGITDAGLTRWAAKPNAAQISRLSLIHQNITSLLTISKILASLDNLRKFTIAQRDSVPTLPAEGRHILVQPLLASKSLELLHWDVSASKFEDSTTDRDQWQPGEPTPNMCLAMSISHNGFPKLRWLQAPRDTHPPGILQSVCQPLVRNDQALDDTTSMHYSKLRTSNNLRAARARAQKIQEHSNGGSQEDLSQKRGSSVPPTSGGLVVPQLQHKSNSDISTSTVSSQRTNPSYVSSRSASSLNQDLISPVSNSQEDFSHLAPDDGIVSPIMPPADARRGLPSRRRLSSKGKQVASAYKSSRTQSTDLARSESICRCSPGHDENRNSICTCGNGLSEPLVQRPSVVLPPRNPLRRKPVPNSARQESAQNYTRFPSLAVRPSKRERPAFCLEPDMPGRDANGGLIGWAELLRIKEKAKISKKSQDTIDRDIDQAHEPTTSNRPSEEVGKSKDLCRGIVQDDDEGPDTLGDLPALKKMTSNASTMSVSSSVSTRSRSKSKSASRLSLTLGRKSIDKDRMVIAPSMAHVARPRGDRGGCVTVDNFF